MVADFLTIAFTVSFTTALGADGVDALAAALAGTLTGAFTAALALAGAGVGANLALTGVGLV